MGHSANPHIKHLAAKLLAIRHSLGLSQPKMAQLLPMLKGGHYRLSEFEKGRRVPNVLILMAYARAAKIPLESIVDDDIDLQAYQNEQVDS
jgi:transcriptional regulator with XRE-family HTH domain